MTLFLENADLNKSGDSEKSFQLLKKMNNRLTCQDEKEPDSKSQSLLLSARTPPRDWSDKQN